MGRLLGRLLCAVGALTVAAGCAPEGSYEVTWGFLGAGGQEEPASIGCGAHGVDAIRILGVSQEGDGHERIEACTAGVASASLPPGTWLFGIHGLALDGLYKEPLDPNDPMATTILHDWVPDQMVQDGERLSLRRVVFIPQPECRDEVDNDRDGRVDTDDPDCPGGDGATESPAPPPT
jgi:hypothetical protein